MKDFRCQLQIRWPSKTGGVSLQENNKMSGQNTPISTTLSLLSLNTPRVSVEIEINSDRRGIKTMLVDFFTGAKLFAKIQRKDNKITTATIQGHPKQFLASLVHLRDILLIEYDAAIVWGETIAVAEEHRFNSITIEETLPTLKRDQSSGEFLERELEEISFGGSAATENVKKIVKEAFASLTNAATGFAFANGLIPAVKEKHISIKYGSQEFDLEVSTILTLSALIHAVEKKLNLPQPIKLLYRLRDEAHVVVTDVTDLREGFLYYALTEFEELPKKQTAKFNTMDEFFDKLKTDESMTDAQVEMAKNACSSQGITCKQLMKTGELAITDAELERIGIVQLGLRKAILAVIKINIQ